MLPVAQSILGQLSIPTQATMIWRINYFLRYLLQSGNGPRTLYKSSSSLLGNSCISPLCQNPLACLAFFLCKACSRNHHLRLRFDEALSHHHVYKDKHEEDEVEETGEMSVYDRLLMWYDTHPRDIQTLRVDVTASRGVENLIERMGQNPSKVTYDELSLDYQSGMRLVSGGFEQHEL